MLGFHSRDAREESGDAEESDEADEEGDGDAREAAEALPNGESVARHRAQSTSSLYAVVLALQNWRLTKNTENLMKTQIK